MSTPALPAPRLLLKHTAHNWGGLAFAFGNVLFIVNKLNEMSRVFLARPMPDVISGQSTGLILLGQLALITGYLAYYRCYAPREGQVGKMALGLLSGGGILLALGHVTFMSALGEMLPRSLVQYGESLFFLVIFGLLFLLIGLIWFGILALRTPRLRHWSHGLCWLLRVQRRDHYCAVLVLPYHVCAWSDRTWHHPLAGATNTTRYPILTIQ